MAGSPGNGRTLLARALPGILPEMSIEESLDVTRIYLATDQLPGGLPLIRQENLFNRVHPCPCGFYGDSQKPYTCAAPVVTKYQKRISGPLLDRIDTA
jgi:predicted ATPase with chaperone activity